MKRRTLTPTKVVFIAILIAALYQVSKRVNPPPLGPPEPPKVASTADQQGAGKPGQAGGNDPTSIKSQMEARIKQQMEQNKRNELKMKIEAKLNHNEPLPKDPGISPEYFHEASMGKVGIEKNQAESARVKKITDQANSEVNAQLPVKKNVPPGHSEN